MKRGRKKKQVELLAGVEHIEPMALDRRVEQWERAVRRYTREIQCALRWWSCVRLLGVGKAATKRFRDRTYDKAKIRWRCMHELEEYRVVRDRCDGDDLAQREYVQTLRLKHSNSGIAVGMGQASKTRMASTREAKGQELTAWGWNPQDSRCVPALEGDDVVTEENAAQVLFMLCLECAKEILWLHDQVNTEPDIVLRRKFKRERHVLFEDLCHVMRKDAVLQLVPFMVGLPKDRRGRPNKKGNYDVAPDESAV